MNCNFCGKEEPFPFVCNYCGGTYCGDHRLPEAHQCKGDLSQKRVIVGPTQSTFSWQSPTTPSMPPAKAKVFSLIEVRDIVIAWLALGLAFAFKLGEAFGLSSRAVGFFFPSITVFAISLVTVGAGFILHELSHKFVAQGYGYWAEFRMWPFGLLLALLTVFLPIFFAAPGATYISGMTISESENGKISLAGPLTNVAVALFFVPFLLFGGGLLGLLGAVGVQINLVLAAFNLIPFGPLDGSKVFRWNKLIWAAVFVPLAVIAYILFFGI